MAEGNGADDLEAGFTDFARALFASPSVAATLREIVRLAQDSIEGCDGATVLALDPEGVATTVAATDPAVEALDRMQIDAGEGPGIDAATGNVTADVQDLADEDRWPAFCARAVHSEIRSVLALPLSEEGSSSLNLFARAPAAFDTTDRARGQLFAALALLALEASEQRADELLHSGHLEIAIRTREVIGQAQGILMERERITADQAFAELRRASQHLNVKLAAVAERLVETGELPGRPGAPSDPTA